MLKFKSSGFERLGLEALCHCGPPALGFGSS